MTKETIKEGMEKLVGDIDKMPQDKKCELFISFYEELVNIFHVDFSPVVNLELIERKELNLIKK